MVCVHDVHASSLPVRNTGSRFGVTRGAEWKGYVNLVMWGGGVYCGRARISTMQVCMYYTSLSRMYTQAA